MPDPHLPAVAPAARPSTGRIWWFALRPKTLSVSVAPVFVGSALAHAETGAWLLWPAAVALLAATLIQIGTNLHNDVADFERGADTPERLGPPRATAMGWLSPQSVRRAAWAAFAAAFVLGIALVARGGWPIVAIGLASLLAGWAYTGGPRPIAYTPFGELFVLIFFGLAAVGGSYYLQTFALSPSAVVAALMLGAFAAAVISVNNTRDLATDARVGKRTLAVHLGRSAMNLVYRGELALPFLLLAALAGTTGRGAALALPLLLAPEAWRLARRFASEAPGTGFNTLLAATARLQAGFAALLGAALLL
ncbi:MAG: 1,4-dihydroxy-2-naphthoate polyprenyltransferase [Azospira sp.]|jgi:1,4-dihydroxy-2-naphthoate octaprenyltransferase|nr:1,4-dihydroxy-2-naphthoate polyprenyltransferase [Azospira sp.]